MVRAHQRDRKAQIGQMAFEPAARGRRSIRKILAKSRGLNGIAFARRFVESHTNMLSIAQCIRQATGSAEISNVRPTR
jgi:hypothetical protein